MQRKKISVLGSTGSIGKNTLSVLTQFKDEYEIYGLSCHTNIAALKRQAEEFSPALLAVTSAPQAEEMAVCLPAGAELFAGPAGLLELCHGADIVVLGVVGVAGLPVFEYCLKHGIPIAIATKEALVYGGRLARDLMDATGTPVLPLDSELSAIFQCLQGNRKQEVHEILLTASGGPFRSWEIEDIKRATLKSALAHPNWSMGAKISIDSATMANKGLEIMETRWMFDIDPSKITVVVHPESIVHSMVRYADGSVMAQLGPTDMRLPIAYALNYPRRRPNNARVLDIFQTGALHFEKPDYEKFPCLKLAYRAIEGGAPLQMVFNAANDVAVAMFRAGIIGFWDIHRTIDDAMGKFSGTVLNDFSDIYDTDARIRAYCLEKRGIRQEDIS